MRSLYRSVSLCELFSAQQFFPYIVRVPLFVVNLTKFKRTIFANMNHLRTFKFSKTIISFLAAIENLLQNPDRKGPVLNGNGSN